jgi:hypothetical protein
MNVAVEMSCSINERLRNPKENFYNQKRWRNRGCSQLKWKGQSYLQERLETKHSLIDDDADGQGDDDDILYCSILLH